jgi:predicted nicotinamide N-methyase
MMRDQLAFSIKFDSWTSGCLETKILDHLDRWEVHCADNLEITLGDLQILVRQKPRLLGFDKLGVAACLWDGAVVLGAYLALQPRHRYIGCRVVELGAGVGFLSVLLAKLGSRVYATDLEKVVDLLKENARANDVDIQCMELEWGSDRCMKQAADICFHGCPDLVVASDVTYIDNETDVQPDTLEFVKLCKALSGGNTRILIGLERRSSEVRDLFMREIRKQFKKVSMIDLGKVAGLPNSLQVDHIDLWDISP